jgi:hypothetical protein
VLRTKTGTDRARGRALFGGLSAEALKIKGVRGYIVDGG